MREIKFRFWDKSRKKFTDYGAIHIDGDLMARSATFGGLYDFADEEMEESIIIQQYTGLKDKNGVEIYEGDIIRRGSLGRPIEVKWGEENCGCCEAIIGYIDTTRETGYEVVGNVYENPELLK